jgi:CLIP-associating protein 1/2
MSAIASLFPVLIGSQGDDKHALNSHDSNILRHALTAFFSAGGIVDRLGDNREKARDCAREALVSAGTVVSRSNVHSSSQGIKASQSGKGPEPPLAIFERYLRDLGFSSKVSRVREQVCAPIGFPP